MYIKYVIKIIVVIILNRFFIFKVILYKIKNLILFLDFIVVKNK